MTHDEIVEAVREEGYLEGKGLADNTPLIDALVGEHLTAEVAYRTPPSYGGPERRGACSPEWEDAHSAHRAVTNLIGGVK